MDRQHHGARSWRQTELECADKAAREASVSLTLVCQDIRDMEFPAEFDLAVNLLSSIGYFSDDEDRLVVAGSGAP